MSLDDAMKLRAADRMAAAIDYLVLMKVINSRSIAADARLDYGQPITDPFEAHQAALPPHMRQYAYATEAAEAIGEAYQAFLARAEEAQGADD